MHILHFSVAIEIHWNFAFVYTDDRVHTGLKVEPHEGGKLENEMTDVWCASVNGYILKQAGFVSIFNWHNGNMLW